MKGLRENGSRWRRVARRNEVLVNRDLTCAAGPGIELGWVSHGIPWGVKDLFATRGYPTTCGAAPYKDRGIDLDATVVSRLDAAGATDPGSVPTRSPCRPVRPAAPRGPRSA